MSKHIILISIDNLRFDCAGYQPDKKELNKYDVLKYLDTPTLDKIAERGLCFTQCISTNTYTTASHASLFTGLYPPMHGVRSFYGTKLSKDVFTLAEVLKVYGYETVMMTDTPRLFHPLGLDRGFDHIFHSDDKGLLAHLSRNKERKLFVFAHFFDVHEPFLLSKNADYNNADYRGELDRLYERFDFKKNRVAGDSSNAAWWRLLDHLGNKDHQIFFPLYVRGVTMFDKGRLNDFMDGLGKSAAAEDCLVVIFSDHGEGKSSSYNAEVFGHGGPLFESVIRVPLIIHHRELPHKVKNEVVSTVDIFPTVLNFALNGRVNDVLPYQSDGLSLDSSVFPDEREVYSETWQDDRRNYTTPLTFVSSFLEQRGIRTKTKKYIVNGTPEVFWDENDIEKMSDEAFVQHLYRGLLCQFENYEDYIRELKYLKSKRNTKSNLLKTVRNSVRYLSKPSFIMYDLEKDPFEERHIALEEGSGEMSVYARKIYRMTYDSPMTEEIFDHTAAFKGIAANIGRLEIKNILETIDNKHIFSLLIDDFVKSKKHVEYDKAKIEKLIMESDEFSYFLLCRFRNSQEAAVQPVEYSNAAGELEMIKNSLMWRIVRRAIILFDRTLFPPGSKRRCILARFKLDPIAAQENQDSLVDTLDNQLVRKVKSAAAGKRMLVISYEVPQFDIYSGAHRFFNLLHIFRELDFSVTVLSDSPVVRTNYSVPLQELGVDIIYGQRHFHHLKGLGDCFDYVLLHTPSTAGYIDPIRRYFPKATVIFDTSDLHYLRFQREGDLTGNTESLRKAKEYKQIELSLAKKSDVVFTVSEIESEVLKRDAGNVRVEVVPNIHRVEPSRTLFGMRRDIIFVGAFSHGPNGDAVFYFLKEIFPSLLEKMDINFYIIGKNPPPELLSLQSPNVIVTGYVPDIIPYFEKCRLMVAPLRYGAGVKGKLTQSMSLGLPFVTTSIGAEGMDLVDRRHCFIADDPAAFADRISLLYTDREVWETFRENSLRLANERFSYETIKNKLRDFFSEMR